MVTRRDIRGLGAIVIAAALSAPAGARADDEREPPADLAPTEEAPAASDVESAARSVASPPGSARPRFHHAPVAAAPASAPLAIEAGLDHPHLARGVTLVYRGGDGALREVPFRRASGGWRAEIPAEHTRGSLGYAIEMTSHDGAVSPVFARREAMHPVQLLPDAADEREAQLLRRLDGRRSVATVGSELADFGSERGVTDRFWQVEGRYTYRPLTTVAEFWIRGGVMRGTTPATRVDERDGAVRVVESDRGLNYGAPGLRLRLHDLWHLELETMASISDEGFSTGGAFDLLVGDPHGSKLVLGAAFVGLTEATYFGSSFTSRVDIAVHERVTVSPIVEVTDMPNAESFGVRLLADVGVAIGGGFSAHGVGGYQARVAAGGGPSIGGRVSYAF